MQNIKTVVAEDSRTRLLFYLFLLRDVCKYVTVYTNCWVKIKACLLPYFVHSIAAIAVSLFFLDEI